jgi:hypothetical protein
MARHDWTSASQRTDHPSGRSVAPISEERERPRMPSGGVSFSQTESLSKPRAFAPLQAFLHGFPSRFRFVPKHPAPIPTPRSGTRCQTHSRALWCFDAGGVRSGTQTRSTTCASISHIDRRLLRRSHELPMRERRQCEASLERFLRRGFSFHPVRAALPWRMPEAQDGVSK